MQKTFDLYIAVAPSAALGFPYVALHPSEDKMILVDTTHVRIERTEGIDTLLSEYCLTSRKVAVNLWRIELVIMALIHHTYDTLLLHWDQEWHVWICWTQTDGRERELTLTQSDPVPDYRAAAEFIFREMSAIQDEVFPDEW